MSRTFIVCTLLSLTAGCEILGPNDQNVMGSVKSSRIVLTNGTGAPIYYFVVGQQAVASISWAQGIGPENEIHHGQSLTIPFDSIYMNEGEKRVVVYWWHAIEDEGEVRTGERYHFVLKIK